MRANKENGHMHLFNLIGIIMVVLLAWFALKAWHGGYIQEKVQQLFVRDCERITDTGGFR
jgi:cell division protein FtsB